MTKRRAVNPDRAFGISVGSVLEHQQRSGRARSDLYFVDDHPRAEYAALVATWLSEFLNGLTGG